MTKNFILDTSGKFLFFPKRDASFLFFSLDTRTENLFFKWALANFYFLLETAGILNFIFSLELQHGKNFLQNLFLRLAEKQKYFFITSIITMSCSIFLKNKILDGNRVDFNF